eukprot:CAMPEP_0119314070 /NCGR_PEP_ID=MMETSP1333-20130426/31551_1 /TAXON_ID=418940 /ORGANISM="Scyphosphaera apsteinii, Strain RCC1455" /LENGTH=185 /DNA_ID=CAMNT_0007319103 /DNA_START=79 /DNA_END=636 /DNA_ORIENTATION=-
MSTTLRSFGRSSSRLLQAHSLHRSLLFANGAHAVPASARLLTTGSGSSGENCRVYIGSLPFSSRKEDVQAQFEGFGNITDFFMPTDRETGRQRGFAFATFETAEEAANACAEMDGKEFEGRYLRVNIAERPQKRMGGGGYGGGGGGYGGGGRSGYDRRGEMSDDYPGDNRRFGGGRRGGYRDDDY